MINSSTLLADLKGQLKLLQADLKQRAEDPSNAWGVRLKEEYAEAFRRERTGWSWVDWRDNEVDQAAVAWIVSTTFLRFCEDNDLVVGAKIDGLPTAVGWIAGPGDRVQRAEENLTAYFRDNPTHNRRHWLQHGFGVLAAQPAGAALVDVKHNPVWKAEISPESATALIAFWRRTKDEGTLVHDFTDSNLETRFLGDLYQDLSEHAKKTYALLQTPVFVEEFILDQTLTPAVAEFGLDGLKLIDPSCGSGHFLLGAFERLNQAWLEAAPGLDAKERVRRAMASINGVDINPFAVAIARFRLTVAGLKATGERSLVGVPPMGFRLAIGDSLLGVRGSLDQTFDFDDDEAGPAFSYDTEDLNEYFGILQPGQYHVVVGNPPYITPKDKALNALYRIAYETAVRQYALSVPFMELLFRLAIRGEQGQGAGYVGQITSNSFMKREFGKKLIEYLFAGHDIGNPVDLTAVIDSSGAWMPGHNFDGTPTVILFGRRRRPVSQSVRAVLGKRDDPGKLDNPATGPVWTELSEHLEGPGFDGDYVTVLDLDRALLTTHPWSLSGGGASDVFSAIEVAAAKRLENMLDVGVGGAIRAGADEVFMRSRLLAREQQITPYMRAFVVGENLRDFAMKGTEAIVFPYESDLSPSTALDCHLWPWRTPLADRRTFQGKMADAGLRWTEYMQFTRWSARASVAITFAEIATHNHFVLDRGGKVFKQTAPAIKLAAGATEEEHLELLGVLNSSTVCFWLKQVAQKKGGDADTPWLRTYAFNSTNVARVPLPSKLLLDRPRTLDTLARQLCVTTPAALVETWSAEKTVSLIDALLMAEAEWRRLRERLFFEQEELDWGVYRLYGLIDADLTYPGSAIDGISLGQRAFEIDLARRVDDGIEEAAWFERHGSTPITELPDSWPEDYKALVQRRLDLIKSDKSIRLLEKPEFKRRWATTAWDTQRTGALQAAILDRLEDPVLWQDPQGPIARSVADLADLLRADTVLKELSRALTGTAEPDLAAVIGGLIADEAVPFLAAYRYKPAGIEKYRVWQEVWGLQRREDAGEKVTIPVPPKYSQGDFAKATYWKARGKLDVPKERFIAYPAVAREGDPTPVLGWAGWSHRDQALALAREIPAQQALGADDAALVPLVAGLVELEPWLAQWHSEIEPQFGASPAAVIAGVVDQYLARMEKTRDQVTASTPPAATRGRRASR
ncbi:BREX-2 system adenine-specific DNA-methyltransferase PglX [Mycolicibacterium septicum DSM 44393]|uniref:site-specific DNA-methyltransferase (adenine-specific) n=1 Tax=Mycolicibacterium septicum DSM 44393 TaxID=1341646 RepID=A0A7X6MQE0_9MYCO|nr:BREX-2 system adenine-specific DNA-methyltransferase PglX [Mycolicibacterium septicum]NKZ11127.1 BREX-2 system adenine-specific DNA-methyltransferase PglX [Mycolicibacterium septicum DSM 44393]